MLLLIEQVLNGFQLGVTLFMVAAGLTLIFGVMGVLNLAHGTLFMCGAYASALISAATGSFFVGVLAGTGAALILGIVLERLIIQRLYLRDHLDQVLATFAIILIANQTLMVAVGPQSLFVELPEPLRGSIEILPGLSYPVYRLLIIAIGIAVALGLQFLITRTRVGMLVRAGASNREMVRALGVRVGRLFTLVFGLGAMLSGLAGVLSGPVTFVQVGMGEQIIIMAFVVIVVGGVGSISAAFWGAILVGMTDTLLRVSLPSVLALFVDRADAYTMGASLASMGIYLVMILILLFKPQGLFAPRAG